MNVLSNLTFLFAFLLIKESICLYFLFDRMENKELLNVNGEIDSLTINENLRIKPSVQCIKKCINNEKCLFAILSRVVKGFMKN